MCRLTEGYFRSIHTPGQYDVLVRPDGTYLYIPAHGQLRRRFKKRAKYRINVKQIRFKPHDTPLMRALEKKGPLNA